MKVWVYLDGRQQGPFEFEQLLDLPVDENTKVWYEGLPRWCAAGELAEMRPLFDGSLLASRSVEPQPDADTSAAGQAASDAGEGSATAEEPAVEEQLRAEADDNPYAPGRRMKRRELPSEPCPSTYIGLSIFLAICCCSPLSIGALAASICTTSFYQSGNMAKARKASEWAAWLIMISIALGFLPVMLLSSVFQG